MKSKMQGLGFVSGLLLAGATTTGQAAVTEDLSKAVSDGSVKLDFRYRFEQVDQEGIDKDAEASTLRSRITVQSGNLQGFHALAEVDNVTVIGSERYNSTANGKTDYPVVADPKGTNINQVYLKWQGDSADATYGRQRILHSNQRFVGGVGWRQNEQTYDGFRANYRPGEAFSIDYSYVYRVHRIFGPDKGANPPEISGNNHFLYADWTIAEGHKLGAFGYFLDFDPRGGYRDGQTVDLSSDTYGVEYTGNFSALNLRAAYARQSDAGDSARRYDADYYLLEGGFKVSGFTLTAGYEVLAADNGVGFATPLATLHKFQGWADKFLATPDDGIEDLYFGLGATAGKFKLGAVYHDFQAEDSSEDFGKELDLVATLPVNEQFTVQFKYATFDADSDRYSDTDKLWLTLQLKL